MNNLKQFLNKAVIIENSRGSKYAGVLLGFRQSEGKFCLGELKIINHAGGITASKTDTTRWFRSDQFTVELDS